MWRLGTGRLRGAATGGELVVFKLGGSPVHTFTTFDDRLVAPDQATGKPVFQAQIADPPTRDTPRSRRRPCTATACMSTGAAGHAGIRGFVAAYNAMTGQERGASTPCLRWGWVPARGNHGGGDLWMEPTIDPATNTVYAGTGNASPDFIYSVRRGCDPRARPCSGRHVGPPHGLGEREGARRSGHEATRPVSGLGELRIHPT
jgi:hypothetical protein